MYSLLNIKEIMRYYLDKLFYNTDLCAAICCSSNLQFVLDLRSRKIVQPIPLQIVPSALASGSSLPPPYLLPGNQPLCALRDKLHFHSSAGLSCCSLGGLAAVSMFCPTSAVVDFRLWPGGNSCIE